jgi:hypothetical protein
MNSEQRPYEFTIVRKPGKEMFRVDGRRAGRRPAPTLPSRAQPGFAAPCARVIKVAAHLKVAPTL